MGLKNIYTFEKKVLHTATEYFSWQESPRCELIAGVIYDMAPAPTLAHQRILGNVYRWLHSKFMQKKGGGDEPPQCEVLFSPIDVKLSEQTIVQPDLVIVCDLAKLHNGKYIDGAPDLVLEVLSPSTALKDRREKKAEYEKAGVKEYLLVNPIEHTIEYYQLNQESCYQAPEIWGSEDILKSSLLEDITETIGEILDW